MDLLDAKHEPRDLAWREGVLVDEPAPADLLSLEGHYAFHLRERATHTLVRDPLGVHKRFFARTPDGEVDDDRLLARLLRRHSAAEVHSIPSSGVLRLGPEGVQLTERPPLDPTKDGEHADVASVRRALAAIFDRLEHALEGREVWVTLSGGLDSSTIAAFAAERFPKLRAMTFRLDDGPLDDAEDLVAARRVAAHLSLPLHEVVVRPEEVLGLVDEALVHGQDWRDFNLHCALVNVALARSLDASSTGAAPVVLTGDGANELFADYSPEQLEGRTYYELPRLPRGRLRRFLIRGLDAGDREVGPFARHGAEVVQPYLLAAAAYAALPDAFVEDRAAKQRLAEGLVSDRLPRFVLERPKVRAQCAREGAPGGTLALLDGRGLDQAWLLNRFAELLNVDTEWAKGLIRAGVYRTLRPGSAADTSPS
ncbi:MAG: 7-cyano-7-deazaguanine synthase [Sandaracinus sp.]|nr:7-cyano-7-deazaguanine synthase [Sandaracinus sp.]